VPERAARTLEVQHERPGRGVAGREVGAPVAVEVARGRHLVLAAEGREHPVGRRVGAGRRTGADGEAAVGLTHQQVTAAVAGQVAGDQDAGRAGDPGGDRGRSREVDEPAGRHDERLAVGRAAYDDVGRGGRREVGLELAPAPAPAQKK